MITFMLTSIYIIFVQLNQVYHLLNSLNRRVLTYRLKRKSRQHIIRLLSKFYHYHTNCLRQTLDINQIFGTFLAWFIVCNTPINALMIMALFYGMVDFAQGYFVFIVIIAQMCGLFGLHWLAIVISKKVHRFSKGMINIYLNFYRYKIRQYRSIAESIQLVPQLKMDSYIWKFHTFKRYGITYGKVRLVTFQTFSRVSIF